MPNHESYILRCIELALMGAGNVSPNPMVGAVIVLDGTIIGEGYHKKYGEPHAEVNAINDVLIRFNDGIAMLSKSIIYVSLEPCSHFGKTPPCADLIIQYKIPHVIIGCRDPFTPVNGKGIEKLIAAGIKVTQNVLKERCEDLNKRFFTRVNKQRPYIILKWAQTHNGYFAPADKTQKWITSAESKKLVHKWRSEEDAVLVGKNTALIDNPQLNVRQWTGRNPKRIVIDRYLQLPIKLHLFDQTVETIVFNSLKTDVTTNVKFVELEDFDNYLPQLIAFQLYLMDCQSIIVEGGAKTIDLFIRAGLWDEARIFTGNNSWFSGILAPVIHGTAIEENPVGTDRLTILSNLSTT